MTIRWATVTDTGQIVESRELDPLSCDCCQTDLAPLSDGVALVYRDRSVSEIRDIGILRLTRDGWTEPTVVAKDGWQIEGCPVNGPAIDSIDDDLAVAWYTGANNSRQVKLAFSANKEAIFTAPVTISNALPLGRVDVSWIDQGNVVVSWLEEKGDGLAELRIRTASTDGSLGRPLTIAQTGSQRASGFPQMLRAGEDLLFAWTKTGPESRVMTARLPLAALSSW